MTMTGDFQSESLSHLKFAEQVFVIVAGSSCDILILHICTMQD